MQLILAIVLSLQLASRVASAVSTSYDGTQVLRVPSGNSTQFASITALIDRLELETWKVNPNVFVDVMVPKEHVDEFKVDISLMNIAATVMHEDLGDSIRRESATTPKTSPNAKAALVDTTWFNAYHAYADHMSYLTELASMYPTKAKTFTIGTSVQGRALTGINIFPSSGTGTKPAIVFIGTVHAREWISTMVTEYIAYNLLTDTTTAVRTALEKFDIYIVPISNPDGFVFSQTTTRLWRKNRTPAPSGSTCIGVDLNRNFNIKWSQTGGASTNPCAEDYKGTGVSSTPEVKALSSFLVSKGTSSVGAKLFIDYHSYGNYMLTPYGYSATVPPTDAVIQSYARGYAAAVRAVHGTSLTVGPAGITLYPTTGSSDDFSFDMGRYEKTYTNEVRDTGNYGFVLPASQIRPTGEEVYAGVKYMLANL